MIRSIVYCNFFLRTKLRTTYNGSFFSGGLIFLLKNYYFLNLKNNSSNFLSHSVTFEFSLGTRSILTNYRGEDTTTEIQLSALTQ